MKKDILLSERAVTESACRASGRAAERHGTSMKQEDTKQGKQQKQEYEQYVKSVTPTHNLWAQMGKAFLTGGIICCIGQFILNTCENYGLDKDTSGGWCSMLLIGQGILNYTGNVLGMDPQTAGSWCSLILVFASVVLTALHIYPKIVKWGGAGALVPITGFANSVTAPAVEYQKEGQVFGIGCKIFTIAGPVILYGIFASWALGLICWVLQMFGIQL